MLNCKIVQKYVSM